MPGIIPIRELAERRLPRGPCSEVDILYKKSQLLPLSAAAEKLAPWPPTDLHLLPAQIIAQKYRNTDRVAQKYIPKREFTNILLIISLELESKIFESLFRRRTIS